MRISQIIITVCMALLAVTAACCLMPYAGYYSGRRMVVVVLMIPCAAIGLAWAAIYRATSPDETAWSYGLTVFLVVYLALAIPLAIALKPLFRNRASGLVEPSAPAGALMQPNGKANGGGRPRHVAPGLPRPSEGQGGDAGGSLKSRPEHLPSCIRRPAMP